ncbi:MAG: response regulator [Planctomycetes bacterium]|nr:response regulator [Planctomycetota bacterium]
MSKRVLICDDEPDIAELIGRYFEAVGCDVVVETDPVAGFRRAAEEEFYLITVDMMMPGMNGNLAINSISMLRPEARILVITGLDEGHEMVKAAREEGHFTDILYKPFTMADLSGKLHKLGL